jgi:fatty-acyl-CoA synthase
VVSSGAELTVEALSEWLTGRIARYKHPKHLVVLDELPRNASGKVVKGTLREKDPG